MTHRGTGRPCRRGASIPSQQPRAGETTYREYVVRDADGNVLERKPARENTPRAEAEGVAEPHTREGAPGAIGSCAPSDGSVACRGPAGRQHPGQPGRPGLGRDRRWAARGDYEAYSLGGQLSLQF